MSLIALESLEPKPIPRLTVAEAPEAIGRVATGELIAFISPVGTDYSNMNPYDTAFAAQNFYRETAPLALGFEHEVWHFDDQSYPDHEDPILRIHDHVTWAGSLTVGLIRQRQGLECAPEETTELLASGQLDTDYLEPVHHQAVIGPEERLIFAVAGRQSIAHLFRSHPGVERRSSLTMYELSRVPFEIW